MDFFDRPYYKTLKFILTISGQWPNQSTLYRIGCMVFVMTVGFTNVIPLIMGAAKNRDNIVIVLQSALVLDLIGILYMKTICFNWNFKKMCMLLNRTRTDWQVWTPDKHVNILHGYAERGRKITLVWAVSFLVIAIAFTVQPAIPKIIDILIANGSLPGTFPYPVDYYYFDEQEYYFYVIAHEAFSLTTAFVYVMASDLVFIVSIQHGCGIFSILGHNLSQVGEYKKTGETGFAYFSDIENMDLKHLAWCVKRHIDAMEYADLIESTYTWSFFYTVGLNMLAISVSGYQIAKNPVTSQESAKSTLAIVTALGHIYFESYMAQILMDHSISIRYFIQTSKWYNASPKVQKLLYVIMIRCNVSCQLTVGKMSVMCFEYFTSIVKTSMSCLTVLRSM